MPVNRAISYRKGWDQVPTREPGIDPEHVNLPDLVAKCVIQVVDCCRAVRRSPLSPCFPFPSGKSRCVCMVYFIDVVLTGAGCEVYGAGECWLAGVFGEAATVEVKGSFPSPAFRPSNFDCVLNPLARYRFGGFMLMGSVGMSLSLSRFNIICTLSPLR